MSNQDNPIVKVDVLPLIEDVAAGIGIIPVKSLKLVSTDIEAGLAALNEHGGPIPFVCDDSGSPFLQQGIRRQTNSWAGHAGIFVGKRNGDILRVKYPDLLQSRTLAGLMTDHDLILPPVPCPAQDNETIEEHVEGVVLYDMRRVVAQGMQAVAFVPNFDDSQIGDILHEAYRLYGSPYDVLEIAHDALGTPDPSQIFVCSSFAVNALAKGDDQIIPWMLAHDIDPERATPADLGRYLFSSQIYTPVVFSCDLSEAKEKV